MKKFFNWFILSFNILFIISGLAISLFIFSNTKDIRFSAIATFETPLKSKIYDEDNEDDLVIYSGSMIGKSLLAQNSIFSDKESYSTLDEDYTNDVMSEASF